MSFGSFVAESTVTGGNIERTVLQYVRTLKLKLECVYYGCTDVDVYLQNISILSDMSCVISVLGFDEVGRVFDVWTFHLNSHHPD